MCGFSNVCKHWTHNTISSIIALLTLDGVAWEVSSSNMQDSAASFVSVVDVAFPLRLVLHYPPEKLIFSWTEISCKYYFYIKLRKQINYMLPLRDQNGDYSTHFYSPAEGMKKSRCFIIISG